VGWAADFIELPNANDVATETRNPVGMGEHAVLASSHGEEHRAPPLDIDVGAIAELDGARDPAV
jgi:hypothetical protein